MSPRNATLSVTPTKTRHGENFPVGSWLVRPALRPAIHAFYTFARTADDIADSPSLAAEDKVQRLDHLRESLNNADPTLPVISALLTTLASHNVPVQHSLDLLVAFRRDAQTTHTPTWEALLEYCRYSASPVGRHVLALHGVGAEAWPANDALCTVLQILNHLQDCGDDLRAMNRVYLPDALLDHHGARREDLLRPALTPNLRAVLDDLLARCAALLETARGLPSLIGDNRLRREVKVIHTLATRLLHRLRHQDPLAGRVSLRWWDFLSAFMGAMAA